ncbi:Stp1/IreP family PP2C-type Ser/Thr phosphatase [Pseudorhodoferax sp. Leaf267]|uniref:Stp1/IreP family PP2C-type Ser/Thr phosphatase n=1 Tax=Pseudorhodoferax sp. Leaf267 TaxID=1736316 RepID=UPI0007022B9F|nr:Stp1/IreP family PP2C-type Ser/Thr phosphatase [Pseudorhodoferax sp. Leaf267]KQP12331.1 protein phosphatase [Pseudorhodoferax sp. Leaf267]
MNYEFCAQTHAGLLRKNNEDAVTVDAAVGLSVLADGMGGYNAGEVASSMAASIIRAELGRWLRASGAEAPSKEVRKAIDASVGHANLAVFNAARHNPSYAGMGTTLVVAVFRDARLFLGHIGDSRCYRLRQELVQITKDHSLLQEQLDAGLITPAQAAFSTQRNLVTRALGIEDSVLLELNEFAVESEDIYLLCSDGLSDMVDDASIASIVRAAGSLDDKARQLVDVANARGGRDNITVLLVQAQSDTRRPSLMARLLRN